MVWIGSVDVASSDTLTVAYFDQTSWTLGDICIEIQCACQIKDRFAECVTLNSHNACRQLDIVEDSES